MIIYVRIRYVKHYQEKGGELMFNVSIPEISDEELLRRYAKIKPVIRDEADQLWWVKDYKTASELRYESYRFGRFANVAAAAVGVDDLYVIMGGDFACLHTYGYYGLFKPTIAEVLAQIDPYVIEHRWEQLAAFEIIEGPKTWKDMVGTPLREIFFNLHYQISTVRLYTKVSGAR